MRQRDLVSVLQQIKELVDAALNGEADVAVVAKPKATRKAVSAKVGLPGHILQLRDVGFFKQPKTIGEVHQKVQDTYPCDRNRVAMALLRMVKHKELRKASKRVGKKQEIAYAW